MMSPMMSAWEPSNENTNANATDVEEHECRSDVESLTRLFRTPKVVRSG